MLCIRIESKFFYIGMHAAHWFPCEFQEHLESLYFQMSGVGQRFPQTGPCVFSLTHPILKKLSYRFKIGQSAAPSSLGKLEDGEQWFYVFSHNNNVPGWGAAAPIRRDLSFLGWCTFAHVLLSPTPSLGNSCQSSHQHHQFDLFLFLSALEICLCCLRLHPSWSYTCNAVPTPPQTSRKMESVYLQGNVK